MQDCLIQSLNDVIKDIGLLIFPFCHFHHLGFVLRLVPLYYEMLTAASSIKHSESSNQKKILKGEGRCFPSLYEVRKLFQYHIGNPPLILIGQNSITVLSARPIVSKFGPATINNKAYSLRLQIKAAPSLTAKDKSLIKFGLCYARIGEGNGNPLQHSCLENPMGGGAWRAAAHGVAESRTRLNHCAFTFHFHALEKEMATRSSVPAWRVPGAGEPGGLPSMGKHRVRHD